VTRTTGKGLRGAGQDLRVDLRQPQMQIRRNLNIIRRLPSCVPPEQFFH
jgi:hypothetical protein